MQIKYLIATSMVLVLIASICISAQSTQASKVVAALTQNHKLIEMSKLSTGHDVVEATINGQTGLFVVDTGAITVINQRQMDKYKLSKTDKLRSQHAAGAGGAIVIDTYAMGSMRIGAFPVPLKQIGVTDLNAISQGLFNATGQSIDGLIGQDVLLAMHAVIDVSNQHLYFRNEEGLGFDASTNPSSHILTSNPRIQLVELDVLEFKDYDLKFLATPIKINGVEGIFIIDSGAGPSMLNSQSLKKFKLDTEAITGSKTSSGAGGAFRMRSVDISAFAIRHLKLEKSNISHMDLSAVVDFVASQTGVLVDGVLGQDILIRHEAIIDVAGHNLYLRE